MALPELFGSYLLHHLLAVGSTSEVFLAQTTGEFPRLCAVKRIRRELARLADFEERFRRDAALLVRLAHGNLVQVLEVGAVEEQPFLAMEHIDGIDLPDLVRDVPQQGPLPPEFGLHVALEMCEAVSYLQLRRREDASATSFPYDTAWPFEVMISFDGVVKVVDLGSFGALRLGQQPVARIFRSPGYAAPEVTLKRPIDLRSDLFAVGLVLWECLAGDRLVSHDPEGYVRLVLSGRWKAPLLRRKDVPGDVIRLVVELLDLDLSRRPSDVDQVRRRLVDALRRTAPAYGSAALSRLLWRRCSSLIADAEDLTTRVARQAPTLRTPPPTARTNTYGKAGPRDRQVARPLPLKVGDQIPGTRYRLVRALGRGGSAEVFAAQHVDLERQVAIKILTPQMAESSEAIAQFRMEARGCSRISHPNIVDVIDFGELDDGRFFFAMELVGGRSLAEVLAEEVALDPARAIGIFRQIAKALQAAHDHGIIHRDIKPENVMLVTGRDGRADTVKLLDFGVMAFTGDSASTRMGTPGYMSPEQVRGAAPTVSMDVYSMGATLYEALCGATPYPFKPLEAFILKQAESPPAPLRSHAAAASVPPSLERVVHRMLERDPAARQGSMRDLEADLIAAQREAGLTTDWDDLASPGEVSERRGVRSPGPGQDRRRPPRLRWAAAALALALGALLVVLLLPGETSRPPLDQSATRATSAEGVAHDLAHAATDATARSTETARLASAIEQAAAQGHFTHPVGSSALDRLQELLEHDRDGETAARVRRRVVEMLAAAADRLKVVGMLEPARTLYREAELFHPDSPRLSDPELFGGKTAAARADGPRPRPAPEAARLAWLVSEIQHAVNDGRYISPARRSALHFLVQLKRLDPTGQRSNLIALKMSRTLRQDADDRWRKGAREEAQRIYRVIALLHPEDRLAQQRARPEAADSSQQQQIASRAGDLASSRELVAEGRDLLRQGKLSEARERFLRAIKANHRNTAAVTGLATVAFEEAHYAQAVELAERAVSMNRRQIQPYLLLGDAYFKLLRHSDALRAWQQVLVLQPDNKRAAQRIAMLGKRPEKAL